MILSGSFAAQRRRSLPGRWCPIACWAAGLLVLTTLGSLGGCVPDQEAVPVAMLRLRVLPPPGADLHNPSANATAESEPTRTTTRTDEKATGSSSSPTETSAEKKTAATEKASTGEEARPEATTEGLTLAQVLRWTERVNPHVQYLRTQARRAESGEEVAFADFFPTALVRYRHVDGGPATFTFPTQPPPGTVGVVSFSDKRHEHDQTELYLQWLVYDFGRRRGRYEQAALSTETAALQLQRGVQTADLNVTVAYFGLLRSRALLSIARETVRRAESNLRDARNLLKAGAAVRNDVLRAEVYLADSKLQLVSAEKNVAVARAVLNDAIGINVNCAINVADLRQEPSFCLPLAGALQLAVDHRPEFGVVLRSIRSARAGEKVAEADFMPRIFVSGAANYLAGETAHQLYDGGVNIELSLFEGGRRVGRVHQAEAEEQAAVTQGQEICNHIGLEVDTAWLGVDEARQRIQLARTAVTQARENLRLLTNLFRQGEAVATEVVDAELAFVRAQENDATALYDYQETLARLAYAIGLSLDCLVNDGSPAAAETKQAGTDSDRSSETPARSAASEAAPGREADRGRTAPGQTP